MRRFRALSSLALAGALAVPQAAGAANHREAPITAIDRTADITDWYTFVSYDSPGKLTMILAADPLLEPSAAVGLALGIHAHTARAIAGSGGGAAA